MGSGADLNDGRRCGRGRGFGGFCPAAGRSGLVGDGFDLVVRVDDEFAVAFGVLDADPDGALEGLRFADDEGQGVVAEFLHGVSGGDDAGVARDDDLGGAVVPDDGPDVGKGHNLRWCGAHELLPYVCGGGRAAFRRRAG